MEPNLAGGLAPSEVAAAVGPVVDVGGTPIAAVLALPAFGGGWPLVDVPALDGVPKGHWNMEGGGFCFGPGGLNTSEGGSTMNVRKKSYFGQEPNGVIAD